MALIQTLKTNCSSKTYLIFNTIFLDTNRFNADRIVTFTVAVVTKRDRLKCSFNSKV